MKKAKKQISISPSLDREMSFNRFRDALVILPALGFLLLLTPVLNFVSVDVLWWGIPARIIQLIVSWAGMIILILFINRKLKSALEAREQ